jgi:hypothetical protein
MIKEAYVSFEIAKLLKEKGFDERTFYHYNKCDVQQHNIVYKQYTNSEMLIAYSAPTHQMACAWLREKGIECVVIPIWNTIGKRYRSYVLSDLGDKYKDNYDSYSDNASYEDAVEAALKYSLENLI